MIPKTVLLSWPCGVSGFLVRGHQSAHKHIVAIPENGSVSCVKMTSAVEWRGGSREPSWSRLALSWGAGARPLAEQPAFLGQVLDDKNVRRRFRASNYQSTTRVKPFICTMPMRLDDGWNQIQFNLSDFTRRAYGTNYIETLRVQVRSSPGKPVAVDVDGNLALALRGSFASPALCRALWKGSKGLTEASLYLTRLG